MKFLELKRRRVYFPKKNKTLFPSQEKRRERFKKLGS